MYALLESRAMDRRLTLSGVSGRQAVQAEIRRAKADFAAAENKRQVCLPHPRVSRAPGVAVSLTVERVRMRGPAQTLESSHDYLNQLDVLSERITQAPTPTTAADRVRRCCAHAPARRVVLTRFA